MAKELRPTTLLCAALLCGAAPAAAQPADRGYIAANALFQAADNAFADRFRFDANVETGSTETRYPIQEGIAFDVGAGVRLWKALGVGVAVSRFTRDDAVETESSIPHPFHDARPRTVAGTADLARTETGVHVHATYTIGRERALRAVLFGGPSFMSVEQAFVTEVLYDEAYPYDTASFVRADTRLLTASAVTVNAGADVSWLFSRNVGLGGLLRFAKATVDLEPPAAGRTGPTVPVDAGGFSAGAGLRIAF